MIEKIIVLSVSMLAISYVTLGDYSQDTQSIGRENNRFDIIVDGKTLVYQIKYIVLDYTPDQLRISRSKDSNSADIALKNGFVMLVYGDLVDHVNREPYSEYTFIKTQYINANADGSAKLAADGQHIEDCKFKWEQTKPIYINELKDAVRDGLIEHLEEFLGEKFCVSVNKTIAKFSV